MAPDRKLLVVLVSFGLLATARANASIQAFNTANQMLVPLNDSLTANNGQKLGRIDLTTDKAYLVFDGAVNYVIASVAPEAVKQGAVHSIGTLPNPLTKLKTDEGSCKEFVLITLEGIIACKNKNGTYAAASFSDELIQQLKANGTSINDYINEHAEQFKASFNVTSDNSDPDGKAADVPEKKENDFSVLQIKPGSNVSIGIGEGVTKITVTYLPFLGESETDIADLQKKLCEAIDGCVYKKKESIISAGKVTKLPGMDQFTLTISSNASQILGGKEAIFEIASFDKKGNTLLKVYYQLDFTAQGKGWYQHSAWATYIRWIPYYWWFPKYRNFYYCSCFVGTGPAAMANILGYFDRRSHWASYSYGRNLYGSGFYGTSYPYDPVAPTYVTDSVIVQRWIYYLNWYMDGSCTGFTYISSIDDILWYLQERTHSNARIEFFFENSYTANGRSVLMSRINSGYPVLLYRDMGYNNYWQPGNVLGYLYYYRYCRYCYYVILNGQYFVDCTGWWLEYLYYMYVEYDGSSGAWYTMNIRHSMTPII